MFAALAIAAVCLTTPVNGELIAAYSPSGQYSGHWGVDYVAPIGSLVWAPVSGVVTFAGSVAGMNSVTIQPVSGFKVSVSYLQTVEVSRGSWVRRGQVVGTTGLGHGTAVVHMSTRINGRYVDPISQMGCRSTDISRALRLVTPPQPYPRSRANRNPGRDVRSDPHRPSPRWRDGSRSGATRQGRLLTGW